ASAAPAVEKPTTRRRKRGRCALGAGETAASAAMLPCTASAVASTDSVKRTCVRGLARRRASMLSDLLIDPPRCEFRRRSRLRGRPSRLVGGAEAGAGAMEAGSGGHRQAPRDRCDLRRREAFPFREQEHLAVARLEPCEGVVDDRLLPIEGLGLSWRRGGL